MPKPTTAPNLSYVRRVPRSTIMEMTPCPGGDGEFFSATMAAADIFDTRPNSPTTAGSRVFEMNEELKEFNRSQAIDSQDGEIHPHSVDASSNEIDTISTSSPDNVNQVSGAVSRTVQETSTLRQDNVSPDDSNMDENGVVWSDGTQKQFIAPKDFELLKVIGMGAFGKVRSLRRHFSIFRLVYII